MTNFVDTCSWLRYNKTKIISDTRSRALRPELLWISVYDSYRGEKYTLFVIVLLKAHTLFMNFCWEVDPIGRHIPVESIYGSTPHPRSCYKEWSAHISGRLLSLAGK